MLSLATPPVVMNPSFENYQIQAILTALNCAWEQLLQEGIIDFSDEDIVTNALLSKLEEIRCAKNAIPLFNKEHFETVVRDAKLPNYNGSSIDEMPDLTFRPVAPHASYGHFWALFVECKVIDNINRTMREYSGKGIARYVFGKYAYHMPQAMMLGYVLCSATLPDHLDNFFNTSTALTVTECKPHRLYSVLDIKSPVPLFASIHDRKFTFQDGSKPGDICLLHAWLNVHNPKCNQQ